MNSETSQLFSQNALLTERLRSCEEENNALKVKLVNEMKANQDREIQVTDKMSLLEGEM